MLLRDYTLDITQLNCHKIITLTTTSILPMSSFVSTGKVYATLLTATIGPGEYEVDIAPIQLRFKQSDLSLSTAPPRQTSSSNGSSGLDAGARLGVGIGVGVGGFVLIVVGLVCCFILRHRRRGLAQTAGNVRAEVTSIPELYHLERNKPELSGEGVREMEASSPGAELAGREYTELEARVPNARPEAKEV